MLSGETEVVLVVTQSVPSESHSLLVDVQSAVVAVDVVAQSALFVDNSAVVAVKSAVVVVQCVRFLIGDLALVSVY